MVLQMLLCGECYENVYTSRCTNQNVGKIPFAFSLRPSLLLSRPLFGLLYQPRMIDDECGAVGEINGRGNWNTGRKPNPVPLGPPQIPCDLTLVRIQPPKYETLERTSLYSARNYFAKWIIEHYLEEEKIFPLMYSYLSLFPFKLSQKLIPPGVIHFSLTFFFFLVFVSGKRIKFLGSRQIVLGLMRLGDTVLRKLRRSVY
jgi:hypothetical protein